MIATTIRGVREEVVDGNTGLLVPTRDSAELAKALSDLLNNPVRACQMGVEGRVRALNQYNESVIVALQLQEIRKRLPQSLSA